MKQQYSQKLTSQDIQRQRQKRQRRQKQIKEYLDFKYDVDEIYQKVASSKNLSADLKNHKDGKLKNKITQLFQFIKLREKKHRYVFLYVLQQQYDNKTSYLQKINKIVDNKSILEQFQNQINQFRTKRQQLNQKLKSIPIKNQIKQSIKSNRSDRSKSSNKYSSTQYRKQAVKINQRLKQKRAQSFICLIDIVTKFIQKKDSKQFDTYKGKGQYNKIAQQIVKKWPQNIYQEIFLNKLKKKLEGPYEKDGYFTYQHCCAIFLAKNKFFRKQQTNFHQHKNYHWPISLDNIVKHVKKTIVGFLNYHGGIIYVGMKQTAQDIIPQGMALSSKQVVQLFQWIYKQSRQIYPQFQSQKKGSNQKMYQQSLQALKILGNQNLDMEIKQNQGKGFQSVDQQFQFKVNEYISLQFISIVDPSTYLDIFQKQHQIDPKLKDNKQIALMYRKRYLVKIKIKPGTKKQTFHLLLKKNGLQQIQSFVREDASVKKLSWQGFLQLCNERMNEFFNHDPLEEINQRGNSCKNCRFNLKIERNQSQ